MAAGEASQTSWSERALKVLDGDQLSRAEALAVLCADADELPAILDAAEVIRSHHHGRRVRIHVLENAQSGVCPEDCSFCSQSIRMKTGVAQYALKSVEELVEGARRAHESGATTYCMVTSTRGPSDRDIATVCEATRTIKEQFGIGVCVSLGILADGQASALAGAGVDRYNHNLETAPEYFPEVATTHTFEDRVATVRAARAVGMEACSGGILGLGETFEHRVELAFQLRALDVESIPVNFLDPRPKTPLAHMKRLSPEEALLGLSMIRLVNPQATDVRMAGGREATLADFQPLALKVANSFFADGYLTTPGQGLERDLAMVRSAGYEPEVIEG